MIFSFFTTVNGLWKQQGLAMQWTWRVGCGTVQAAAGLKSRYAENENNIVGLFKGFRGGGSCKTLNLGYKKTDLLLLDTPQIVVLYRINQNRRWSNSCEGGESPCKN
jgi:hypothetical protein